MAAAGSSSRATEEEERNRDALFSSSSHSKLGPPTKTTESVQDGQGARAPQPPAPGGKQEPLSSKTGQQYEGDMDESDVCESSLFHG